MSVAGCDSVCANSRCKNNTVGCQQLCACLQIDYMDFLSRPMLLKKCFARTVWTTKAFARGLGSTFRVRLRISSRSEFGNRIKSHGFAVGVMQRLFAALLNFRLSTSASNNKSFHMDSFIDREKKIDDAIFSNAIFFFSSVAVIRLEFFVSFRSEQRHKIAVNLFKISFASRSTMGIGQLIHTNTWQREKKLCARVFYNLNQFRRRVGRVKFFFPLLPRVSDCQYSL